MPETNKERPDGSVSGDLMPGTDKERPDGSVSGDLLLTHAWNRQGKT